MNKNDLIKSLQSIPEDFPIFINCSFNSYEIKQIVILEDRIELDVGETNNPIDDEPLKIA